jgi:hypothetical protein
LATTNQRAGKKTAEERMQLIDEHVQAEARKWQ